VTSFFGRHVQLTLLGEEVNRGQGEIGEGDGAGRCLEGMKRIDVYRGFEVWRTSAGHLVVREAGRSQADRLELVELLAMNGVLDALFFPSLEAARKVVDGYVESREILGQR